ncbi:MAG: DUF1501 domain-containing protein [Parvularculaceae bacterium]|nr:DUF1501 domain-containing protein [Parvularculaceae bacterium]
MFSRRGFLKSSAMTFGAAGLAPVASLAADSSGYKALVCVFLYGGCDSQDILIGHDQSSYDAWATARQSILERFEESGNASARARESLLALAPLNASQLSGPQVALPPEMSGIHSLFNRQAAAFVPNVGPLLEPTNRRDIEDGLARLPARLQSHNDQQSTWQAFSVEGAGQGWGGQVLDAFNKSSPYSAISISGQAVFLSGNQTRQLQLSSSNNIRRAYGTDRRVYSSDEATDRLRAFYANSAAHLQNPMMRDLISTQRKAIDDTEMLATVLDGISLGEQIELEDNRLSSQLGTVADLIAARSALDVNRQIFFVGMGGFDTHNDHATRMPALLGQLSDAVTSFYNAIESAGLADQVTLFTASDFGRTLTANATGTDHGWGGHQLVVGGSVRGGRIHGSVPSFDSGHELEYRDRGALIPQHSIDQYAYSLGSWFGLSESELNSIFPNRGRFDLQSLQLF